ncbi:unnamed protein product [Trichobilharzia szidati]|nr:unnamed protein product [Trichobilharzia szidati]
MHFKINEDFAKNYNRYRQKEEYERLKAKHGDAKLKNTKLSKKPEDDREATKTEPLASVTDDEEDESTSSSSSDSDNESWEEKEQEDFLTLYQALCTNDPSLDDPNKQWFRDPDASGDSDGDNDADADDESGVDEASETEVHESTDAQDKKAKKRALKLRDYEREFLLNNNGLEDEITSREAEKIVKMESDDILRQLKQRSKDLSKEEFLKEANAALKQAATTSGEKETEIDGNEENNNSDLSFLRKRKSDMKASNEEEKKKRRYDLDKIVFTDQSNKEAEEFLRDYILNKRWREPNSRGKNSLPTYSDILRESGINPEDDGDKPKNLLNDDDILDEDDEFLIKVNNLEQQRLQSLGVNTSVTQIHKTQHRFEEEDKEFIKTYPRHIESSIGQTLSSVKSKRAERRKAKAERKRKEKEAKFQELTRLRNLKLSMLAEKIERIKRTCGPNSLPFNTDELISLQTADNVDANDKLNSSTHQTKKSDKIDALDVAEYLDEDWDPEKHEKLLNSMFGKEYEEIDEDMKKPEFSDDSDLELDDIIPDVKKKNESCRKDPSDSHDIDMREEGEGEGEELSQKKQSNGYNLSKTLSAITETSASHINNNKSRRGKRRLHEALERNKPVFDPDNYPDYEKYFEEFYQLHCEDIIPGPNGDEDIYCRFKYRDVVPNDYGLSAEEILKASTKELNAWVSLKRATAYLSNEEEMKDKDYYNSQYQMHRKSRILTSLNNPEVTWWPNEKAGGDADQSEPPKKKNKRRRKKKKTTSEIQVTETPGVNNVDDNNKNNLSNPAEQTPTEDTGDVKKPKEKMNKTRNNKSQKQDSKALFKSRLLAAGITMKEYYRSMHKEKQKSESVEK